VHSAFIRGFDALLYPEACLVSSRLPKPARAQPGKPLVLRPGPLRHLIAADIALQELGRDSRDCNWLIDRRAAPWAIYRGIPHVCFDEEPLGASKKVWDRYSLVINSEQILGLPEACALMSRADGGRLVSFETNRGASFSDTTVPYDWRDRHETLEFGRLFATAFDLPDVAASRRPRPRAFPVSAPPLVVIAGLRTKSRKLSLDEWTTVITKWHRDRPFLVTGAEEDGEFIAEVARRFPKLATRLAGSFDERCDQISWSEELLAMEGSAVQIASFFGVPTTAIFTSGRVLKWHPLGERSRVIRRHDLPCQPCEKLGQVPACAHHYACHALADVAPENVWQ
jgi:hypothetical protein